MPTFVKLDRAYSKFLTFLNSVVAVMVFAIMTIITADVVARTVFHKPFQGVSEIVANSIVILCFLEIPYALMRRSLVRTTLVYDKVSTRWKDIIDFIAALLGIAVFSLLISGSWPSFLRAVAIWDSEIAGSVRIPTTPGRFAIVFGSVCMVIEFVFIAIKSLIRIKDPTAFQHAQPAEDTLEGGAV